MTMFGPPRRQPRCQPRLECLETRTLLSGSNVLVNNTAEDVSAQDTQSETTITLGTGSNVIVAFNDSEEFTSGSNHFTGYAQSNNSGASFTDEGGLPNSTNGDVGDPVLAHSARTGEIFLSTLSFTNPNTLAFFKSSDNGVTFGGPVNSAPGYKRATLDKDWMTVDNFPGKGQGIIYVSFTDFAPFGGSTIRLTRSLTDGATWIPPQGVALSPSGDTVQGSYIVVGPDHVVYDFYLDGTAFDHQQIMVTKSTNFGQTFSTPTPVVTLATTGVNGDLGLNGGFRTNAFPHVAVNPVTGALYLVYNDKGIGSDLADIYFTQSTNGGASWSNPVRVDDDLTSNDQWQPDIAVTPDGTKLFSGWYDRRLDPHNSAVNWFGTIADINGSTVTFRPNFRISSQAFPVVIGQDPVVNTTYMGDYDTAVADNSFFYTTWGDNRLADAAHTHNPDVRFSQIPVSTTSALDTVLAADRSLAVAVRSAAIAGGDIQAPNAESSASTKAIAHDYEIYQLDQYWQTEFRKIHHS
jgi:hypothetical protein